MNLKKYQISALLVTTLLAGCANQIPLRESYQAYDGAPRDERNIATIYAIFGDRQVPSGKIDHIDSTWITLTRAVPLEVKVAPGPHNLKMLYGAGIGGTAGLSIDVNAEAGHTYEVKSVYEGNGVRAWIEDKGLAYVRTDWAYKRVHP